MNSQWNALRRVTLVSLCLVMASMAIYAQTITAILQGTVADQNGALVSGANVKVTSQATGLSKSATTNDDGSYTIPFLQSGIYNIVVEKSGFKKVSRTNVTLEIAQTAAIDFSLEVGDASAVVEVSTDQTPLLQTETSNLETTIENKLVEELPSVERNIFSFVNLVPGTIDGGVALGNPNGAVGSSGNRNFFDSNFSVNGGRASSNDVLLDGVTNTIGDFNGVTISPPQDGVREFKVISGVASAEYGRTSAGVVTISTKAGSKQWHGALYEYYQDGDLNANGWARNRRGRLANGNAVLPRIDISRNQFGGALGGPLFLPRFGEGGPSVYGKGPNKRTFFFLNIEGRRERNPFSKELTVPTERMRRGDLGELLGTQRGTLTNADGSPALAGQIYNPFGGLTGGRRAPIAGNRLDNLPVCASITRPTACLDPVALRFLSFLPAPNQTGLVNNYVFSDREQFSRKLVSARIDHTVSSRQSFFGRFSYEKRYVAQPSFLGSVASNSRQIRDQFGNFTFNHIYSLSNSIINNFRYGYTRVRAHQIPISEGFDPSPLGLPSYITNTSSQLKFPTLTIGGGAEGLTPAGEVTGGQIGGAGNNQPRDTHQFANAVTILSGKHTMKAGVEYRLYRFYPFQSFDTTGNFGFTRTFTRGPDPANNPANAAEAGSSLATFLLGLPTTITYDITTPITIAKDYWSAFYQDDWRVRSSLTLNLGLRWDVETGTRNGARQLTNFDLNARAPVTPAAVADPLGYVQQLRPDFVNLRGLLGFPDGPQTQANKNRFAPRVGFAYSYNSKTTLRGGYGIFFLPLSLEGASALGLNFTNNNGSLQSVATQQAGASTIFLSDPFPGTGATRLLGPVGNSLGERTLLGQNLTFAVEPQRRTAYNQQWNLVVQRELARNLVLDIAYVGSRGLRLPARDVNVNQVPSQFIDFARSEVAAGRVASVAAFFQTAIPNPFANLLPGTALNTATIARGQLLRRFPQYQAVNLFRPHIGYSTYHAAQFNLQKRFSDGLSALVNYTWSKQLDTSGVGNGASFLDPTTVEDISNYDDEYSYATYDVPHRMTANFVYELPLGRKKRFGKDWNGISQAVLGGWQISGSAVYQSGAPVALVANGFPGLGLGSIGNQVRRADIIAGANPQLSADTYRANARAGLAVFNRAAFAIPGDFFFGTAPRTLNGVRRDTYKNVDLTATKNFYFADGRNKLQLRAEFLNAFNITVFGTPATNINDPNFGTVTSQGNRPRIIQLVGRFTF